MKKKILILGCAIIGIIICIICFKPEKKIIKPILIGSLNYDRDFNDFNDKHIKAAQIIGIPHIENRKVAQKQKRQHHLVEITSNNYYILRNLDYSIPYLVPEAADLLNEIGKRFQKKLKELNAPIYKLEITSVTRTREDVKNLRKINQNASANSVHCYATTMDISWSKYTKQNKRDKRNLEPYQLKQVLGLVLRELKEEKRCYVKHEKKQACFHITARPL